MPAQAAQVFGPTTVDPGFNSTGEKTLLTMSTTLPAGGRNVIIAVVLPNGASSTTAQGYYAIKKGTTVLSRTYVTASLNTGGQTPKSIMLLAVDTAPSGNDSYTFVVNITTAGSSTFSIHVQGMVIKTDDAAIVSNSSYIQVNAGATNTIVSLNTSYAANSKVAVLALVYYYNLSTGTYTISSGNIRIKLGTSIISSNQFNMAFDVQQWTGFTNLCALATPSSSSQTWSVEIYNNTSVNVAAFAILVTFTVFNGAFLDTASVALTSGSQVTVGNLTTSLVGDVAVIGIAAAENTNTSDLTAFNAGNVVLQKDNSATGQISNLVVWWFERTSYSGRAGTLPLLRVDIGVSNPSYQIKMTAATSGINGEAKILAFTLITIVSVSDSGSGAEVIMVNVTAAVSDSGSGVDSVDMCKEALDSGAGAEYIDMLKEVLDSGIGYDYFTGGLSRYVDDSGAGMEYVDISKESLDAGSGVESVDMIHEALDAGAGAEAINMSKEALDSGAGVDAVNMTHEALDSGAGVEAVNMTKESLDSGSAVELVNMAHEALDSGSGIDMIFSPRYNPLTDSGSGVETAAIQVPQSDAGAGVDISTVTGIIPILDSGSGVDIVTQVAKEVIDSGAGVEAVYISASVAAYDSGIGTDIIGIVAQISVEDFGTGVEFADLFLSMYGMVLIDNDDIGYHSIPYKDWRQRNIPVQVHRRSVSDKVYIDSDEIGDVVVEWEDKVSDVIPGERTLIVTGVVELYD